MPRQVPRPHPVRFAVYVILGLLLFGAVTGLIIAFAFPDYQLVESIQQGFGG